MPFGPVLSQLAFFLVTYYLCFNLSIKQLRRQRSNPEKIGTQSRSQIHTIPSTILLLITVFHIEPYHFRYNRRNNLGTIINLYQTQILNSLIHFDKYFIKKTQKKIVHPLCVSGRGFV